jgi:hydrogenase maturation protein HypF
VRLQLSVRGWVQGVGFRPFVFRLATALELAGFVRNSTSGVCIQVEGPIQRVRDFQARLWAESPVPSAIQRLEEAWLEPTGATGFRIDPSDLAGARTALDLPALATCADWCREFFDPQTRRFV